MQPRPICSEEAGLKYTRDPARVYSKYTSQNIYLENEFALDMDKEKGKAFE